MPLTDGQDDGAGQPAIEVDGGVISADLVWRHGEGEEDGGEGARKPEGRNSKFDKGQYCGCADFIPLMASCWPRPLVLGFVFPCLLPCLFYPCPCPYPSKQEKGICWGPQMPIARMMPTAAVATLWLGDEM